MKPTFMILGSVHLDNPDNGDVHQLGVDNIQTKKRQEELQDLIESLKKFAPTKIAIEISKLNQSEVTKDYHHFLNDEFQLLPNEKHQIAFQLAKQLKHPNIYAVDWNEFQEHVPLFFNWAMTTNPPLWREQELKATKQVEEVKTILTNCSLKESLLQLNHPDSTLKDHQQYLNFVLMSEPNQPIGAQWVAQYWYYRNLLIYKHLTELIANEEERILVIYGRAHVHLLTQFLKENGDYLLESPCHYLA